MDLSVQPCSIVFRQIHEAISKLAKGYEGGSASAATLKKALQDKHYAIRVLALIKILVLLQN
ncbi:MAG: hypothetical protein R2847_10215 [Bacteroidia bacterium]